MSKLIVKNSRAYHDYFVKEDIEVGIALLGTEIKSLRQKNVSLTGSYATILFSNKFKKTGELFLKELHIKPYKQGSYINHEAKRDRKLLAHKRQINKLTGKLKTQGATLIPLELYFKDHLVKVKLGLCVGKKHYDKRESLKKMQTKREMEKFIKKEIPAKKIEH